MIRRPNEAEPSEGARVPARRALTRRVWIWASLFLVALTWTPVLGIHVYKMSLGDPGAGTVVVVFPPTFSTRDSFRSIVDARGSPVRPVSWIPRTWIVHSPEGGFAGRLRERGAWGVYSPELLSVRQLLSCSGMVAPANSPGPAQRSAPVS